MFRPIQPIHINQITECGWCRVKLAILDTSGVRSKLAQASAALFAQNLTLSMHTIWFLLNKLTVNQDHFVEVVIDNFKHTLLQILQRMKLQHSFLLGHRANDLLVTDNCIIHDKFSEKDVIRARENRPEKGDLAQNLLRSKHCGNDLASVKAGTNLADEPGDVFGVSCHRRSNPSVVDAHGAVRALEGVLKGVGVCDGSAQGCEVSAQPWVDGVIDQEVLVYVDAQVHTYHQDE